VIRRGEWGVDRWGGPLWPPVPGDRVARVGQIAWANGTVPTPGTHKGPTAQHRHPVPLHVGDPPRHQATVRRGWERGWTTCSGTGRGWGWMGPCGCQASRRRSMHGRPKTVGERGHREGRRATIKAHPAPLHRPRPYGCCMDYGHHHLVYHHSNMGVEAPSQGLGG
jgi:hypothetical protein